MQVFKDMQQCGNRYNSISCKIKLNTCSYFMFLQHINVAKEFRKVLLYVLVRVCRKPDISVSQPFAIEIVFRVFLQETAQQCFVSIFELQLRERYCRTTVVFGLQNSIPFFPKMQPVTIHKFDFCSLGKFWQDDNANNLKRGLCYCQSTDTHPPPLPPSSLKQLGAVRSDERTELVLQLYISYQRPVWYITWKSNLVRDHLLRVTMVSSSSNVWECWGFLIFYSMYLGYRSRNSFHWR